LVEETPKFGGVVKPFDMAEFVQKNMTDQIIREEDQAPAQADVA
jgi:hypothetical protein